MLSVPFYRLVNKESHQGAKLCWELGAKTKFEPSSDSKACVIPLRGTASAKQAYSQSAPLIQASH